MQIFSPKGLTSLIDKNEDVGMPENVGDKVKWRPNVIDAYHLMFADALFHNVDVLGHIRFFVRNKFEVHRHKMFKMIFLFFIKHFILHIHIGKK